MGADGHIEIYDWTKTLENFPELKENKELKNQVVGWAYIYDNPVDEGKWLIGYWGDNLFDPTFPGWNEYTGEPAIDKAKEIVYWMRKNAQIVSDWEVWT